ncbi:MAG: acyl carrier protein [Planctomycetota bacterium]|mgnify:CR=1 FL=1|nr:MAG: acyl carrier protein [Planctomycetota bacterium]REJ88579.1 MAG: acyl carrier protein [Planctomycetota bacterium]REK17551.1 MAG: acyl carrier protein [Planctomycetota bacterium]REK47460.1 MAG: acyl carrier protein [Planctomycetota bacterium]
MTDQQITERVRKVIANELDIDDRFVAPHARLERFGVDSLDKLKLLMDLEAEFDVELSDTAGGEMRTVSDAANLVRAAVA